MDVRKKLVELLQDENNPVWGWFPNNMAMMQLADYLNSNGVTVQERSYQSITEEKPSKHGTAVPERRGSMRLIDADALMDVIRQHEYRLATKQGSIGYGMFTFGIQQAVDEQPTIDAVPVVRCENCSIQCACKLAQYLGNDGFCSYGDRKEGEE